VERKQEGGNTPTAYSESSVRNAPSPRSWSISVRGVARTHLPGSAADAAEEQQRRHCGILARFDLSAQIRPLGLPALPVKTMDKCPQKTPQWPGHIRLLIAQVIHFDEVQETRDVQPFGCFQNPPTFH